MDDYEVGQEYEFANRPGRWRYKGGPVSDSTSWEQVQAAPAAEPRNRSIVDKLSRMYSAGGTSDFLRMMAQGATFGFADELAGVGAAMVPGGKTRAEATAASRDRVAGLREAAPVASFLAEMAGGVAIPALAMARPATVGGKALAGGIAGGAAGAAYGLGEGEGSLGERAQGAVGPGAIGAAVGAALPLVGAGMARGASTAGRALRPANASNRVASSLRKIVGDEPIDAAFAKADEAVERVSREMYQPLEAQHPAVLSDDIKNLLTSDAMKGEFPPRFPKDVVEGTRAPSLSELQGLRNHLRRKLRLAVRAVEGESAVDRVAHLSPLLDDLDNAMQAAIPNLADADAAYRQANQIGDALALGRKNFNKAPGDIRMARAEFERNPAALEAFRRGQLTEILTRLDRRADKETVGLLKDYIRPGLGPNNARAILRTAFPDDASFEQFVTVLNRERSAEVVGKLFKALAIGGGIAGAARVGLELPL